jgi:hypothetical protein
MTGSISSSNSPIQTSVMMSYGESVRHHSLLFIFQSRRRTKPRRIRKRRKIKKVKKKELLQLKSQKREIRTELFTSQQFKNAENSYLRAWT